MKFDLRRWMAKAVQISRAGNRSSAAAAMQQALQRLQPAPSAAPVAAATVAEVLAGIPGLPPATTAWHMPGIPKPAGSAQRPSEGMVAGHHAEGQDGRDYQLYVPPQAGRGALPLVVMLHGCTQGAVDFAAGTAMNGVARERGFFVLYPEQSARANPQRCWNWFKHNHQQRGRGEPALLAGMVRRVMAEHDVDRARVYVAGLSAGGAMAAIVGAAYPELFAAVGVHSGLAPGAATDLPGAMAAMRRGSAPAAAAPGVPTIVFHGDADTTVHPRNGDHVAAASAGAAADAATRQGERIEPPGRRAATRRVLSGADGRTAAEHWVVHGAAHAWAGGDARGSYTDPQGPDATREMVRFFLEHPKRDLH